MYSVSCITHTFFQRTSLVSVHCKSILSPIRLPQVCKGILPNPSTPLNRWFGLLFSSILICIMIYFYSVFEKKVIYMSQMFLVLVYISTKFQFSFCIDIQSNIDTPKIRYVEYVGSMLSKELQVKNNSIVYVILNSHYF